MPVQSWGHAHYWRFDDGLVPPPPQPGTGGYPAWQSTTVAGSLFGALQAWWERLVWAWHWAARVRSLSADDQQWLDRHLADLVACQAERRMVVTQVLKVLQSEHYPLARQSVRETAQILDFNTPTEWSKVGVRLRGRTNVAENTWRHLEAVSRFEAKLDTTVTVTNPFKNLIVELGYQGYSLKPRD